MPWGLIIQFGLKALGFIRKYAFIFLIGATLLYTYHAWYNKAYSKGYSNGYAKAVHDRPTYGNVGTVNNDGVSELKYAGAILKLGPMQLKLGI